MQVLPRTFYAKQSGANKLIEVMLLVWEYSFFPRKKGFFFFIYIYLPLTKWSVNIALNGAILDMTC